VFHIQGSKVSRKELFIKSVVYRFYTTIVELFLASLLKLFMMIDVIMWVIIINMLKLIAYFLFDMGWFSYFRRPGILKHVKRWFRLG